MDIKHKLSDTPEYKALFRNAKLAYPNEYDMLIHLACLEHLRETSLETSITDTSNIISNIRIDTINEVQEINTAE